MSGQAIKKIRTSYKRVLAGLPGTTRCSRFPPDQCKLILAPFVFLGNRGRSDCVRCEDGLLRGFGAGNATTPILSVSSLRRCFCFSSSRRCRHHSGSPCRGHPDKTFRASEVIQTLKSPAQCSGLEPWAAVSRRQAPLLRETLFVQVCDKTVNPQDWMR